VKPRIYLRRSIWVCRVHVGFQASNWGILLKNTIGHGYSPAQAYADWLAQINAALWPVSA
jgi:hypothetical protein